jgi:hypothetical protein
MKKILVLGVVAVLLASALVLISCGPACPSGGSSKEAGDCVYKLTGLVPDAKVCESKDCGVYKYVTSGDAQKDILSGKTPNKKCDC